MSELIKREDAINAVEMFFKDAYIEDADVHCTDMVYEINHIPTASPWHRVEEPPKVSCKVIAYAVSNSTGERDVTTAYYKQRSSRFHITGRRSHWRVTHWMPIEPPKEDA